MSRSNNCKAWMHESSTVCPHIAWCTLNKFVGYSSLEAWGCLQSWKGQLCKLTSCNVGSMTPVARKTCNLLHRLGGHLRHCHFDQTDVANKYKAQTCWKTCRVFGLSWESLGFRTWVKLQQTNSLNSSLLPEWGAIDLSGAVIVPDLEYLAAAPSGNFVIVIVCKQGNKKLYTWF